MKKIILLSIILLTGLEVIQAQNFKSVIDLAQRRVPWLAHHLEFTQITPENGKDVFEISSVNDKIHIEASSPSAATEALGFYLKNYCHRSMSNMGDNLSIVSPLPRVTTPVKIAASAEIRYALNYCTINYTMSFYKWKEWGHELDWIALNGVNLLLAPVGTEIVWQNTLKKLGCTDKEISNFIASPAFTAWWLMGNLQGWGGPVSQEIINQQSALEKKILKRMKDLGMQPVMQGFYGMVPTTLKKFELIDQGRWAGGFIRPAMIKEGNGFSKVAGIYYSEMKRIYGNDLHYFGGDPFHEGGNSKGVDVAGYGRQIQDEMQKHFPGSICVLQGWQNNPKPALLSNLDKTNVLVLELFGENTDNWFTRKGYESTPFVWCTVSNFGGRSGLYGKLQRFANEVYRADASIYSPLMKGIGIMPEGIDNNPVVYDFVLDLGWHQQKVEASDWIPSYVSARYGKNNDTLQKAWQTFLQTVYSSPDKYQEGPPESVFCARPSFDVRSAATWGNMIRNYDQDKFKEAVKLFNSASQYMKDSRTYQIDKINFVRQVLSNEGQVAYSDMIHAFNVKNLDLFVQKSDDFLSLLKIQDSLLSGNPSFQLHTWLMQAWDFGKTISDKKQALKNAKTQITYWGPDNPSTDLHDYANKEWSGLMKYFYLPKWRMFVKESISRLKGQNPNKVDYFSFEKAWTEKPEFYLPENISSSSMDKLVKRVLY